MEDQKNTNAKAKRLRKKLHVKLDEIIDNDGMIMLARDYGEGGIDIQSLNLGMDKNTRIHIVATAFHFDPEDVLGIAQAMLSIRRGAGSYVVHYPDSDACQENE